MTKLKAFPYFGGKLSHLNFILQHLPYTERYIEPFGGSASVLLNREPSPVETFNDLDGDVVNFFRVLREQPDELVRQLELTPHSREEFTTAFKDDCPDDSVERARRFFVRMTQGYNSKTGNSRGTDWSYAVGTHDKGMSRRIAQAKGYHDVLHETAERLSRVQIENRPAIDVIECHDHEDALIYCDPPYTPDTRCDRWESEAYACDMTEQEHRELARTLRQCDAKVAISNYDSDLLRELYADWNVVAADGKTTPSSAHNLTDSELLITNYDPTDGDHVQTLDDTGAVQNRLTEFCASESSE